MHLQSSNSATLASLLAILEPKVSSNNQRDISGKPIIFILNEFDMFALRDARQSFLYCLLDMVQSGKRRGGMAVLGLSARTDCINILEKRVKSRCQSRVLQIAPPASLDAFLAVGRASLTLDAAAVPAVSGVATKKEITVGVADWNAAVAVSRLPRLRSLILTAVHVDTLCQYIATKSGRSHLLHLRLEAGLYARAGQFVLQ